MKDTTYLPRFERQPGVPFVLTERDIEMLKVINRYRYLRTGQIKRLVFPDNASLQSTRRRLRGLYHNGSMNRMVPEAEVAHPSDRSGSDNGPSEKSGTNDDPSTRSGSKEWNPFT